MTTSTASAADPAAPATPRLDSFDPATGALVGSVPITPAADIPAVVARARAAAPAWAALTPAERAAALDAGGRDLAARAEAIGTLLCREMGKPLKEAIGEVTGCGSSMAATTAEIAAALEPIERGDAHTASALHFDPLGVCAAITPWNFPVAMPHWLVVPALMAGNTVVLKPSELTPLVAQAYADCLIPHLPEGVLQVVHGADDQGKALVAADVDLVAFTGSREVGQRILAAAGPDLKRVILELGGKDPMIVLDDADVDKAARFAVRNSFRNAGQVCVSTERIYVDERVAGAFEDALLTLTAELVVGPGTEDGVDVGPMISGEQRDHVLAQVERAAREGATVRHGEAKADGNFIRPIVLTDLTHDMEIMREETFGPVACVMRVDGDDEAVRLANDTPFGLGAVVFGGDEDRAAAVARRLNAGMIGVNRSCGGAGGTPWVGAGQSGYNYHGGPGGHRQFTQTRVLSRPRRGGGG
jgi:acyl-CoA reductase-like NAD-dependent aldehyde dehydrogenase